MPDPEPPPIPPPLMPELPAIKPGAPTQRQFPCRQCGAMLTFAPGTHSLKCQYCGTLNEIAGDETPIEEIDYHAQLRDLEAQESTVEAILVHCGGCGADSTLPQGQTAGKCPFCGRAIVATGAAKQIIKPKALLPFAIDRNRAQQQFMAWIAGLWFAPSKLKSAAQRGQIDGVYLPAWTYDCDTTSRYTGQRGEDYWTTEWHTVNGKRQSRRVKKTRWYPAAGSVQVPFDDVLVLADRSLPDDLRNKLDGFDLPNLLPYQDDYLSGFVAEAYQVDLPSGFELAKEIMVGPIQAAVRSDIGGDQQRISSLNSMYFNITFKHILLPVWISAYQFNGKTFRFVINGRNGAVFGQRPYSFWKITLLVLAILLAVLIVIGIVSAMQ